jgi:hypothetical protein
MMKTTIVTNPGEMNIFCQHGGHHARVNIRGITAAIYTLGLIIAALSLDHSLTDQQLN